MVSEVVTKGTPWITIDVILAIDERCWRKSLRVASGSTASQALAASGLLEICRAQTGAEPVSLGVFGRKIAADYVLQEGERLELYRALVADPRQRRRERAAGD